MKSLLQHVADTIGRHRMFEGARRIGVAVSGGADSICLLHALLELDYKCLTVLHADHGLRGAESRGDAEFVRETAVRLGLPFRATEFDLKRSGNLEENARRARLAFFREAIASGAVDRVAVGHTRSDQAETVLFRLLRGAGTPGLAGIRPVTSEGIVRPLIEVDRREVESYLRARQISWRDDSTNADVGFARNRIRHELLPQLERDWNRQAVAALARTAEQAAADEEFWAREIDRLAERHVALESGAVMMDARTLAGLSDAVARRLIRRAIELAKGDLAGIAFGHIDDILGLVRSNARTGRVQVRGLEASRSFDRLRFGWPVSGGYRIETSVPGASTIPGTNRAICLELIEKTETMEVSASVYNSEMCYVDWGRVSGSLLLRSWAAGDRYQPIGGSGVRKLKTLFQIARIPSWERIHWPVLVDGSAIVWTRRFGPAAGYTAGPQSRTVLRIRELDAT